MAMTKAKDAIRLRDQVVDGAASATGITVTGITTADTLISVIKHQSADPNCVDVSDQVTVTANTITLSNSSDSVDGVDLVSYLNVTWLDNSG